MLDQIFNDCKKQLSAALKHKKHAFRFFTLASKNLNENINLRTVVLRDFDPEQMTFTIFTDARSKKVKELNENSHSQFLFYDSKRMIQLLILSKVKEIHHQESTYNIIPDANNLSPAYIVFDNYEIILKWNRSLRFSLAVCTLKEKFKNEL